jgi:prefoldin subunit 5
VSDSGCVQQPTGEDQAMGLLDDAKKFIDKNDDKIDEAIEKAGDLVDQKTDGKFADKIDKVQDIAQEKTGEGDTAR